MAIFSQSILFVFIYFYIPNIIPQIARIIHLMESNYKILFYLKYSIIPITMISLFSSFFLWGYKIIKPVKQFQIFIIFIFLLVTIIDRFLESFSIFSVRFIFYSFLSFYTVQYSKIGNPIKFNSKKQIHNFLVESSNILQLNDLYNYFWGFVKTVFGVVDIEMVILDHNFGYTYKKYHEKLESTNKDFVNINAEIVEETEIGSFFENKDEFPRLFFKLRNNNGKLIGSVSIGKRPKLYWAYEEELFFKEIINVINRTINNIIANQELFTQKTQFLIEQEMHKRTKDSIEYASLIQNSILPRKSELKQYIKDFFIIWKPKAIVGGDFYWFYPIPKSKNYIIAEIDCTGHGVPGAFMSMTANSILNNIVREKNIYEPDKILNLLHKEIRYTLRQQSKESQQDGMDISLCYVNVVLEEIHFAGAMQHLFIVKKQNYSDSSETSLQMIKGDRFSIGGRQKEEERIFAKHTIKYNSGDIIYLMSDGLADQKIKIDGKETRLKIRHVKEMLLKYSSLPMDKQKEKIENELAELQGELDQRDDITVIGVK